MLDSVVISVTTAGIPVLVALVAIQWWSKLDRLHVRRTCVAAGLSFMLGLGVNQVILQFVHRVMPGSAT
jgi:undecaprenyl-diphosphatase